MCNSVSLCQAAVGYPMAAQPPNYCSEKLGLTFSRICPVLQLLTQGSRHIYPPLESSPTDYSGDFNPTYPLLVMVLLPEVKFSPLSFRMVISQTLLFHMFVNLLIDCTPNGFPSHITEVFNVVVCCEGRHSLSND